MQDKLHAPSPSTISTSLQNARGSLPPLRRLMQLGKLFSSERCLSYQWEMGYNIITTGLLNLRIMVL